MRRAVTALAAFTMTTGVAHAELRLSLPVDCAVGLHQDCYIQNYVDADPGPDYKDFACKALSYDGHKGTDFAVKTDADMERGVDVIASAPGLVRAIRDGLPDIRYTTEHAARVQDRECGNGVVIDHGSGWQTQYCHLRQGSVQVTKGDVVNTGDVLGQIGMSGKAAFPHVHLSVRKKGQHLDPFNPTDTETCQTSASADTLWSDPPDYVPTGLLAVGFATTIPEYIAVKEGTAHIAQIARSDARALVLWGFAFGSQPGDILKLRIVNEERQLVFKQDVDLTKTQAQYFRAGGRRTQNADWFTPGVYSGMVEIIRDGRVMSSADTRITITSR